MSEWKLLNRLSLTGHRLSNITFLLVNLFLIRSILLFALLFRRRKNSFDLRTANCNIMPVKGDGNHGTSVSLTDQRL